MNPKTEMIDLNAIQIRPEFQARSVELDEDTLARYRESVETLPPLEVWPDPESGAVYLVSGRHRLAARRAEGCTQTDVIILEGSYEDAFVRSRTANAAHGLPYRPEDWRRAMRDVVKARCARTNAWIAREIGCSPTTVARVRLELERAGEIPCLEVLEAENGRVFPRPINGDDELAGQVVGSSFASQSHPPLEEEEEDSAETGEAGEREAEPDAEERVDRPAGRDRLAAENWNDANDKRPANLTLKLGCLGKPLAVEAGLWIDGKLQPVPVTLLIAANPPVGWDEAAPGYDNCLIITQALARQLNLLFD